MFNEKYSKCRDSLLNTYYSIVKKLNLNRVNESLESIVKASMREISEEYEGDDLDSYLKNHDLYEVHEFITLTAIMAYNNASNIDIDRLKEKSFGYTGCFEAVVNFSSLFGVRVNEELIVSNLLSIGRSEDYKSYISSKHYEDDIDNVLELMEGDKKRVGAKSQALRDSIADVFDANIESALSTIKERYSYILEGTFGIDQYKGVYTNRDVAVMVGVSNGHTKPIQPDKEFASYYGSVFNKILDLQVNDSRQFDLNLIKNTVQEQDFKQVKPIYFPFKVLEIVKKCGVVKNNKPTFTRKTQLYNYQKLSEVQVGTIDKYLNILESYFSDEILDYIFICLVDYCRVHFSVTEDVEDKIYEILDVMGDGFNDLVSSIQNMLKYYVDCVTTAVVLDKLELSHEVSRSGAERDKIIEFRFKVCSRLTQMGYTNRQFITSLIESKNVNSSDMSDIEETVAKEDELGFSMIDLKYTFDSDKVNARPTFAYKALETLLSQQEGTESPVNWQNILLGRDLRDKIVISGTDNSINLQSNQVHWIFSGSRSGKGVMCYNIFATAIGSKLPIFYLDRKPDTATVLSEMCPEMFCVNGGQYDSSIDSNGVFNPSKYPFRIPSYLSSYFASEENKFDFLYFRSLMLVFAMFDYADTYKDSAMGSKLLNAFGGGVVLVLDEFSNFIKFFMKDTKPMSASSGSWLSKAKSQTGIVDSLSTISSNIQKARVSVAKTKSKKGVSQEEIDSANKALDIASSAEFEIDRLYWAALADSYQAIKDSMAGKKDAAGAVAKTMQIFVIGQDFSDIATALDNPDWFNTGAENNKSKFNKSNGINPLVHLLAGLKCDVITGYQADRPTYLAQGDKDYKTKDLLNKSRRCFAYKSMGFFTANELHKITDTKEYLKGNADSIKNYLNNWKYFKPFLILNNSVEPPECLRGKDCAPDAKTRENMRKGIIPAPDGNNYLASQYVGQCLCSCEEAGLSWKDLLADNDDGTGHLNRSIGFQDYICQLAGGIPTDSMALSGKLATEFVQSVYGYSGTWLEFVCDFRPEWIVSTKGYTADGSVNKVQDKLADSFFFKGFLALNPAEILGDKLESLLPYYSSQEVSNNQSYGIVQDGFELDEEEEEIVQPVSVQPVNNSSPSDGVAYDMVCQMIGDYADFIIQNDNDTKHLDPNSITYRQIKEYFIRTALNKKFGGASL